MCFKKINMRLTIFIATIIVTLGMLSCSDINKNNSKVNTQDSISGKLTIFHAGSLSVPVKIICDSFHRLHPNLQIYTEACGSKQCARNITDLHKACDVFISADYKVIDQMLIPNYATWNIPFASNEMTIVFNKNSKYADEINQRNWFTILLKKDVAYGRSDPNSDPCGVRAVLTAKLAEQYYSIKGLSQQLLSRDNQYIRPKETDLLALLETNTVDYIFLYKSVAQQHKLNYIILPDEINLKKPEWATLYKTVSVEVNGTKPGEKTIEKGEPMIYSITVLTHTNNSIAAYAFVDYFLSKGINVMVENGQPSVIPAETRTYEYIPAFLKKYAKKPTINEVP